MKKIKIGEILIRVKEPVVLKEEEEYKRITIRSKNQGILKRDVEYGNRIGTKKQFFVRKGQFLLSKIDARNGAFGIVSEDLDGAIITGNFWTFEVNSALLDIDWFNTFVSSKYFIDICSKASSGTTNRQYLDEKKFLSFEINLPDMTDQKKFVTWYGETNRKFNEIKEELKLQKKKIENIKEIIVTDAIKGRMNNRNDSQYSMDYISNENSNRGEKDFPPHWNVVNISQLINSKKDIRTGPFGSSLSKSEHQFAGIPVWGIESIGKNGVFSYSNKIFISENKAKELESFSVESGDIIISRSGTVGELCVLPPDVKKGIISTNLMKISLNKEIINPYYFCYLFKSTHLLEKLNELCKGSTRIFLTQKILNSLPFLLPPLNEQNQIVDKINQLMNVRAELEATIEKTKQEVEKLKDVMVLEAFSVKEEMLN
ncbi:restriction endonuclease subunit S [Planococcus sp. X10-3]|uniref:restriction endonuclease subunit S n=1 Tax=Planococcus sp. X10-3 TaxID=3061240 RepID=UPI003BB1EBDB